MRQAILDTSCSRAIGAGRGGPGAVPELGAGHAAAAAHAGVRRLQGGARDCRGGVRQGSA